MKSFIILFILILIPFYVGANNSLITIDDIPKMKKAGISQNLIEYLINNQTCSIDANTVIRYHKAGLKEQAILKLIKADAYRPERESTVEKELRIIGSLKQAGFSDEAILEYLNSARSNQFVDNNGDSSFRLMPPMETDSSHEQHVSKKKFKSPLPYPATIELNPFEQGN
ncbi:conserved hypothetical protein, secreted [Candidatus Magnetomorum sp. HK-1]|nr:conserved hypothetical protein, secreted [Candidatus Magnetomorum sp. HK-1]